MVTHSIFTFVRNYPYVLVWIHSMDTFSECPVYIRFKILLGCRKVEFIQQLENNMIILLIFSSYLLPSAEEICENLSYCECGVVVYGCSGV